MNKKPPAFIINGQPIAGSLWGKILKACGGDKWEAGEALFRARRAENIVRYVSNGLSTGTLFKHRLEEEGSSESKRIWIEENIFKLKKAPAPVVRTRKADAGSMASILKGMGL